MFIRTMSGTIKAYCFIKRYFWAGMRRYIDNYVCNHTPDTHGPPQTFLHNSLQFHMPIYTPSSRGNSYVLTCLCLLKNFPVAISMPSKSTETFIQAYLQHMYATYGISLIVTTATGFKYRFPANINNSPMTFWRNSTAS